MFGFLKKLFGCKSAEETVVAPYKIEAPEAKTKSFQSVEPAPATVKLRQPGQPKQGQKPTAQKKPAQPKLQAGQKPAANKPRGRKPKAKPAAPQQ